MRLPTVDASPLWMRHDTLKKSRCSSSSRTTARVVNSKPTLALDRDLLGLAGLQFAICWRTYPNFRNDEGI
jgi:hypothetical protein